MPSSWDEPCRERNQTGSSDVSRIRRSRRRALNPRWAGTSLTDPTRSGSILTCIVVEWVRLPAMAFGQLSGPPASVKQVRELLDLLKDAGHSDFRDARGPMGFTQRQAAGKFSRDEAAAFITQLLDAESDGTMAIAAPAWRQSAQEQRQSAQEQLMSSLSTEQLAGELRRRGWTAIEPESR
jgi:hypothetical protein